MLPRQHRLAAERDIRKLLQRGRRYRASSMLIRFLPSPNRRRFCVVVSNKVSKKATVRNLHKRRIRAILARTLSEFAPGDYLFSVLSGQTQPSYSDLQHDIQAYLSKQPKR